MMRWYHLIDNLQMNYYSIERKLISHSGAKVDCAYCHLIDVITLTGEHTGEYAAECICESMMMHRFGDIFAGVDITAKEWQDPYEVNCADCNFFLHKNQLTLF